VSDAFVCRLRAAAVSGKQKEGSKAMYTYALIDHGSGYVWGVVEAADPLEACHRLDAELGAGNDRGYEITRPDFCNESGYHVYRAPAGFDVDDGTDDAEIARVAALGCPTYVRTFTIDPSEPVE